MDEKEKMIVDAMKNAGKPVDRVMSPKQSGWIPKRFKDNRFFEKEGTSDFTQAVLLLSDRGLKTRRNILSHARSN